jgi:chromosome segregation ATPase
MADDSKQLSELVSELIIEQQETRRELVAVFNTGFTLLADKITEMKGEITEMKSEITFIKEDISEIKLDVRSIDRRLRRFEDEQVLPRLLDLDHRLTAVERKVA